MTCPITSDVCANHGFVHGKEAEDLRRGLEGIIAYYSENYTPEADPIAEIVESLRNLLDRVDARDSVAFLEAVKAQEDETNRTYLCAGCLKRLPWSNGCADDMPNHCDDCWVEAHKNDSKKEKRCKPMKTAADKNTVDAVTASEFLNSLVQLDQEAMQKLADTRVPCNKSLVDHPTVQTSNGHVGLLGIINGLFGTDDRGWGHICATFDGNNRLIGFCTVDRLVEKNK